MTFGRSILGASLLFMVSGSMAAAATPPTVVLYMIDGLQTEPARVAAANGATNIKFILDNGVRVTETYTTSPAPYPRMPDGSLPWGDTTSSNIAIHTGTHVFESRQLDDIFLSATRSGIKSVFAGGADNYRVFTTATFLHTSQGFSDAQVVDFGIQHLNNDGVRLIRLHPQRIRDAWSGPAASTRVGSNYQKAIINADKQLGRLIDRLKALNLWSNTYVIIGADHGMNSSSSSDHPPRVRSSWSPFMAFYGPGLKKNATIPYAETPDIALMAAHFLGIERPRGYASSVNVNPRTPTATFLSNLFEGAPQTIPHPQYIRRYLVARNFAPPDPYTDYRAYMLSVIAGTPTPTPTSGPTATPTPTPTPTTPGEPTPTPTATPVAPWIEITPGGSGVSASTNDGNAPANAVDNSLATRWSGNGDGAWLKLDLGAARAVNRVKIAWYNGNLRASRFDLQVSNDNTTWSTVFNAQSNGTSTAEETFDFTGQNAQWIRYLGHGNTDPAKCCWNSVTEISIFGPPE
jgi:hypothetical protein